MANWYQLEKIPDKVTKWPQFCKFDVPNGRKEEYRFHIAHFYPLRKHSNWHHLMPESKKIGGFSIKGWAESATLVGIGLIDPPKIWGARHPCVLYDIVR